MYTCERKSRDGLRFPLPPRTPDQRLRSCADQAASAVVSRRMGSIQLRPGVSQDPHPRLFVLRCAQAGIRQTGVPKAMFYIIAVNFVYIIGDWYIFYIFYLQLRYSEVMILNPLFFTLNLRQSHQNVALQGMMVYWRNLFTFTSIVHDKKPSTHYLK